MKSINDFGGAHPSQDYRDYLMNYYVGLYVAAILANPTAANPLYDKKTPFPEQVVKMAISMAEETINKLP